ncbi:TetR/AcrR family transcriptional regulator [Williamsia sterculiae]|uniref:Transcriptional regulator, TetR family n=1 Tax=Williamsia sterculiae TaxID=1344003 RepID=A0A1N7DIZ9_9NOCA|nr:TetR/AcrR family transcriptional regulator [Williamsia sterculiae]SIR75745.1 transcriptional regulator, TetR family [Williamsia sterculiae]
MNVGEPRSVGPPRGPRPDKRLAILAAARAVFAGNGYPRTSMEAIASRAGVSNKTLYNHFRDKADLFAIVIERSATEVAEAQLAIVEDCLSEVPTDLAGAAESLIDFSSRWTASMRDFAEHQALVEALRFEVGRAPAGAVERWQLSGPARVRTAVAEVFARWTEHGLLCDVDPDLAAVQFARLIAPVDPLNPLKPADGEQAEILVESGVRVFLRGYGR